MRGRGCFSWKRPPAVFASIKQRSFLIEENYEVCKKYINRKDNAELVGKSHERLPARHFGTSKFEWNWIFQDHFFRTTQKQLPVPFPSKKSNTRQTELKVVWRLLAKHVWKSSLEDLSTEVTFKNRLVWAEMDHYWKKVPHPFSSKNKDFSKLKQSFKAGIWHINREKNANSVEFHRLLAQLNVEFLNENFFIKWWFFTKNVNCLRNWWLDWSEYLHASSQQNFEKTEMEQKGVIWDEFFKKAQYLQRFCSQPRIKQSKKGD